MDPVTQGTLGAAAAQALLAGNFARRFEEKLGPRPESFNGKIWLYGALGGMAADLDILIRSTSDPILKIYYHRHFTHSLSFIPLGGLLCGLILYGIVRMWGVLRKESPCEAPFRRDARFLWITVAATAGYATHALLDACTTYGTLLWWPFSMRRESWSLISIIDPLYTFPLLGFVIVSVVHKTPRLAQAGLAVSMVYLAFGGLQHYRAHEAQERLAKWRGHEIVRGAVFPSFANNITWRSVYEADGNLYADKIRVPWFGNARAQQGESIAALREEMLPPGTLENPASRRALDLIRWFSSGWIAQDRENPHIIGDMRYSFSPTEFAPIWGVGLYPDDPQASYTWESNRRRRAITSETLAELIWDDGSDPVCLTDEPYIPHSC